MANKKDRKPGFYFVKIFNRWEPAEWDGNIWTSLGSESGLDDEFWSEIDETEVKRNG